MGNGCQWVQDCFLGDENLVPRLHDCDGHITVNILKLSKCIL